MTDKIQPYIVVLSVVGGIFLPVFGQFSFLIVNGGAKQLQTSNVQFFLFKSRGF